MNIPQFLATYFLHSTVLLAATWLALRIVCPRSPVLVERLWKLAAVLPVITALAISYRSLSDYPASLAATHSSDVVEGRAEDSSVEFSAEKSDSVEHLPDDQTSSVPITTSLDESVPPLDVPFAVDLPIDSLTIRVENDDRRMGTLARPPSDEWLPEGTGKSTHPTEFDPDAAELIAETDVPPSIARDLEDRPERAESWSLPAWQLASALLPIWALIGAVWLVIRSAWFRWRLRNARRVEHGRAFELLREFRSQSRLGLRPDRKPGRDGVPTYSPRAIRLLIVPGFAEPAAFGLWRPTIVLPPSCESLDREALRAVLAHELGHIARGDLWWLALGRVLTTVFGFQPLNRIARREWSRAAECLCDDWAVGRGVERLTLARCLTALAEHRLTGVSLADALAAVGSPSSLRQRVERLVAEPIVDPWSNRSRRWLLTSVVAVVAAVTAMTLPLPEFAAAPAIADDELDAALIGEIEAEFDGLRTELQHVARLAEQQAEPDWNAAAELFREREERIVERWRRWQIEKDTKQETSEGEH